MTTYSHITISFVENSWNDKWNFCLISSRVLSLFVNWKNEKGTKSRRWRNRKITPKNRESEFLKIRQMTMKTFVEMDFNKLTSCTNMQEKSAKIHRHKNRYNSKFSKIHLITKKISLKRFCIKLNLFFLGVKFENWKNEKGAKIDTKIVEKQVFENSSNDNEIFVYILRNQTFSRLQLKNF